MTAKEETKGVSVRVAAQVTISSPATSASSLAAAVKASLKISHFGAVSEEALTPI
ncbi:hypothetical protein IRP70_001882 [Salmonella enterica]|uniref:hypothetical protein n=1 Tax=Salmonella enterica TaxID=28901 RepID=UPI0019F915AC|nr:hypothetical protein [Salmonella enterica]EFV1300562.1 hypothetical protein [Salmonella enterica]EGM2642830.1 hypothetical protein [Salmonella enterica]EGM2981800.1 hypothetical protein [Salmonella enterica]EGO2819215.1 hypothetical protein [Salmonella enterica]